MRLANTITLIALFTISILNLSYAQSVGVNDDGSSPNAKAMLDVKSNAKGVLIPRMSTTNRIAIAPVMSEQGLMVYDTTVNAFFYYTGSEWKEVSESLWSKDPVGINRTSHVGINTDAQTSYNLYVRRPFGVVGADTSTIYAYRGGDDINSPGIGGSSFAVTGVDAAIKGFSDYGNPFSAGVAGYGFLDYANSAALIGSNNTGTIYGILGFRDTSNVRYAGYFKGNTRVVGDTWVTGDGRFDRRLGVGIAPNTTFTLNVQSSTEDRTGYFYNTKNSSSHRYGIYAGSFGDGTGDHSGGSFDANGGTGTNYGVHATAIDGTTNIGLYSYAAGGTKNWAAHFDSGDVIVDDRVGIGTQTIASGVGLHVMSQDIQMEGNSDFFNIVSTSTGLLNGLRFYNGSSFQGALFYDSGDDLLNITGFSTTPLLVTDFASSRVGIGTFAPVTKLQIVGGSDASLSGLGYFQLGSTSGANVVFDDNEIEARNNGGQATLFLQRDDGVLSLCGTGTGSVAIGDLTGAPTGYLLSVDGKIITEELRIRNSLNWPDYVFSEAYELMPLKDLEAAISAQKHLPNFPSAEVVEQEGILIGDMQKRMMEKIEELTLYVIDINNKNEVLSNEVANLKRELSNLKKD